MGRQKNSYPFLRVAVFDGKEEKPSVVSKLYHHIIIIKEFL